MDPFAVVLLVALAVLLALVLLLGRYYPGSGLEQLGLKPPREVVESREALEAADLDQLLAATNARRRRRGLPERTHAQAQEELGGGSPEGA
ncbi:MAG: hypothetical protein JO168_22995 [Solirubrobacterales bacterium]|nr:hypothetical protein [Solirubrobacterales bacterium]MBV9714566.1 hypothetical protein [Solirubrobacterales bacterium]